MSTYASAGSDRPEHRQEQEYPERPDGPGKTSGCEECDPDLIDELKCHAQGIAAQAAYNATSQPELETARTQYDTTRKAYREARSGVALEVQDLRHQIKHLIERIRCLIKQRRVVECLDEAYEKICRQLDECGTPGGCCADPDCDFDKDCPEDYRELVRRIADYEAHLEKDKACFNSLVGEPAALTARVAAYKADVDAVSAALQADPATTDLKQVYASALVAQRHLKSVWYGFPETRDFIDCLCRALTCWTKAADAVSVLLGCKAIKDCHRDARATHCQDLADHTVDEILVEYERICGHDPCADEDKGEQSDDDHDDDDRGSGHHHHGDHDDDDRGSDHHHHGDHDDDDRGSGHHHHGDRDDDRATS